MMITNAQHFLDEKGAIGPQAGPARALAQFIGAIITLATHPEAMSGIAVKCRKRKCKGEIIAAEDGNGQIVWRCPRCGEEGIVSHWQGTLWDVRSLQLPETGN